MKNIFRSPVRLATVALGVLVLSACGAEQGSSLANSPDSGFTSKSFTGAPGDAQAQRYAKLYEEEKSLNANPICGEAGDGFKSVMLEIVDRFNQAAKDIGAATSIKFIPAGYPDSPDGISVRVCADSRIAAYAYSRTVAIHEGLLTILKESTDGATDADKAESLFTSAVAFVLYHELGHIHLSHTSLDDSALLNTAPEFEADMFAAMVMRATGYSMEGVDLVFSVLDLINPSGSLRHPASWERAEMVQRIDMAKISSMDR